MSNEVDSLESTFGYTNRSDARDFLTTAGNIGLRPAATAFSFGRVSEALLANSIGGAAVVLPGR
jgi:hypothetical protein